MDFSIYGIMDDETHQMLLMSYAEVLPNDSSDGPWKTMEAMERYLELYFEAMGLEPELQESAGDRNMTYMIPDEKNGPIYFFVDRMMSGVDMWIF